MSPIPITIGDFTVLPISISPLPSFPVPTTHYIYLRQNASHTPDDNSFESLFLTNVPVDSTETHLRTVFTSLVGPGKVTSVVFENERKARDATFSIEPGLAVRLAGMGKKRKREALEERARDEEIAKLPETWSRQLRKSGSSAIVTLVDDQSIELVFKAIAKAHRTKKFPVWAAVGDTVPSLGSTWIREHNKLTYPDRHRIEDAVNMFFTLFNQKEKEAAELAKRMRNEPDEDGFVTVTRGGNRSAPANPQEAEEARKRMLAKEQKKKDEMVDFYRFQLRERRKMQQEDQIRKFQEDRKKVDELRKMRGKFRPQT